jgi:phytoene synthase
MDQTSLTTWNALLERVEQSPGAYFATHSKSFAFAARFFPPDRRRQVAQVYAFCRTADDLADGSVTRDPADAEVLLHTWLAAASRAYAGDATGIGFLDEVMADTARAGVPFGVVAELVEGLRTDFGPVEMADWGELHRYSYRVAGVIGIWLTRLFGVHDPWVLDRAEALGHALQLTNILRDVGEDLAMDRIYLPRCAMHRHGISRADLQAMAAGDQITPGYRALIEETMAVADRYYAQAYEGMAQLPAFFARPVAIAAGVYHGIHAEIRAAGYDNLRRRARTSATAKPVLAARGLWRLQRAGGPTLPRRLSTRTSSRQPAQIYALRDEVSLEMPRPLWRSLS